MNGTQEKETEARYAAPAAAGATEALGPQERVILDRINRKVAGAESIAGLLGFLLEATRPVSPCDRIGLAFLDESGGRLVSYSVRALYEPIYLREGYSQDLRGSSLQAVIEKGAPRIIDDMEAYLAAHPGSVSTRLLVREGVRSNLTCPLAVDGRNVGVLFRSARRPCAYDERQVRLHEAVAERLSQAVEKAYRIEQLAAANRAYMEMLRFVSHEIKSPLAGIIMEAHVLSGGYVGALTSSQEERVQRIKGRAEYLAGLVQEYLDLATVESGGFTPRVRRDVGFAAELLDRAADIAGGAIERSGMRLTRDIAPPDLTLTCDPAMTLIVLLNLLDNATKYGRRGGEIRVRARVGEGQAVFSVWNEGPGFTAEEQNVLFRKFSRLDRPEFRQIKGTGVGLYTAWRIVQLQHGRIRAASDPGKWAEFSVELPLAIFLKRDAG